MFLKKVLYSVFLFMYVFVHHSKKGVLKIGVDSKRFLSGWWGSYENPHLVNWVIVFLDKKNEGLGIRNLSLLNKALIGKWSWRFAIER